MRLPEPRVRSRVSRSGVLRTEVPLVCRSRVDTFDVQRHPPALEGALPRPETASLRQSFQGDVQTAGSHVPPAVPRGGGLTDSWE